MSSAILQERGDEFAPGDGRQGTGNAVGRGEAEVAEGKTKGSGLYLYGIIQDNQERRWSLIGIGGAPAIYSICHGGLSAIVSDGCGEMCETTQEDLLAHNHVLEQVMKTHSVLPLRWGTVARSEAELRAFLQKAHRPLRDALGQIEGKVEFDVDAEWNGNEIFRLIEEQHEEVRKYKEHLLATGQRPGSEEQLAAGILVANAIARQRAQFAKAMEAELKPWSERVSSLQDRTKQTVFNAAFLVQEQRTKPFEEAIYRLGDLHGRILKFRYAGPLPCYNFVNLHVMMVEFQAVDEARRTLGLGDHIILHDHYIPNDEVGLYYAAADCVALPYITATQSGIVQICYNYHRPVIATDVGGLPEVVQEGKTGFIVPAGDAEAFAQAIIRFYEEDREAQFSANVAEAKKEFSWEQMASAIEGLAAPFVNISSPQKP